MSTSAEINNIQLFKSVFSGREDVFEVRWEKENKSGCAKAKPPQYRNG